MKDMHKDLQVGDLVIACSRQIVFGFGNLGGSGPRTSEKIDEMGFGVVVDVNPLFINGRYKIWWSRASKFTREEVESVQRVAS